MDKPWYEKGLRFACTECGKCCTGAPGYVWLSDKDIQAIADFLNLSSSAFLKQYTKKVGSRISLIELSHNFNCVFLKGKRCSIYPVRPIQCRTFPWWPQNLESKSRWEETAQTCEGISSQAPAVSFEDIEQQRLIQLGCQTEYTHSNS